MGVEIKKVWDWVKSIWQIASNITKVLGNQDEIKERLKKIEEAIKSPQYQVTELEKIKLTVELVQKNNEEELKRLKAGSQEEIAKHKAKIEELENRNAGLAKYKVTLLDAVTIIKEKDSEIKRLNDKLIELDKKVPPDLNEAIALALVKSSAPPNFLSSLARVLSQKKDLQEGNK